MKKELTAMLTANTDMSLKINGAFKLNLRKYAVFSTYTTN